MSVCMYECLSVSMFVCMCTYDVWRIILQTYLPYISISQNIHQFVFPIGNRVVPEDVGLGGCLWYVRESVNPLNILDTREKR